MTDAADQQVDTVIDRLQSVVDELKSAQEKDDDEDETETPQEEQPKTLKEARILVKEHFRRRRQQA